MGGRSFSTGQRSSPGSPSRNELDHRRAHVLLEALVEQRGNQHRVVEGGIAREQLNRRCWKPKILQCPVHRIHGRHDREKHAVRPSFNGSGITAVLGQVIQGHQVPAGTIDEKTTAV